MHIHKYFFSACCMALSFSCAAQKETARIADRDLLNDSALASAHTGISIYDVSAGRYLYNHQGAQYFIPASNTKIITCYAAMKYLKHILTGIRYYENDTAVYLTPTGDPTLLHPDFANQPVIRFLQQLQKKIYITNLNFKDQPLGAGWAWDDYNEAFMPEKNALPVYGNVISWVQEEMISAAGSAEKSFSVFSDPEINWKVGFDSNPDSIAFMVKRNRDINTFNITEGKEPYKKIQVPFVVNGISSALELLADTIGKQILIADQFTVSDPNSKTIWSQPADSVLKPMMHRSDNFFAEQLMLMISEQQLGVMSDELIIDTILKTDLRELPQAPTWVDGSGLSRYNLITPQSLVAILDKMQKEFGMNRIKEIFPTGGEGTLTHYYKKESGYIYAKTGSMSGVTAISGFLYTKKNRLLIFSVMVNNHRGSSSAVRRSIERFLRHVRASN